MSNDKTALIIGVDGQDGSYLSELLLDKGYKVVGWVPSKVPVNERNLAPVRDRITLINGDLLQDDCMYGSLKEHSPVEIYNLAAPSFPASSWEKVLEVGEVAGLGVSRLLEATREICPKARFYQASTSELFGEPLEVPQRETTPFHPRNPYGVAKLYAHWMTVNYRLHYGMFAVCGILYNHESPRRGLSFVTRKITRTAAAIKLGLAHELALGNLDARRDWGYAGDYVQAMWTMLQFDVPEDFVIGTGETHSVRDFCKLAFSHLGLDYLDYVVRDPRFFRPPEKAQLIANPARANNVLGWRPKVSFSDLVKLMVEADLNDLQAGPASGDRYAN